MSNGIGVTTALQARLSRLETAFLAMVKTMSENKTLPADFASVFEKDSREYAENFKESHPLLHRDMTKNSESWIELMNQLAKYSKR